MQESCFGSIQSPWNRICSSLWNSNTQTNLYLLFTISMYSHCILHPPNDFCFLILLGMYSYTSDLSASLMIDWCCFYYFLRNSLVALLEALFARDFPGKPCLPCHIAHLYLVQRFWQPFGVTSLGGGNTLLPTCEGLTFKNNHILFLIYIVHVWVVCRCRIGYGL